MSVLYSICSNLTVHACARVLVCPLLFSQANLRYRELNEALEGVQEKLKDVRVSEH